MNNNMPLFAGTYNIVGKIGSGGGGIVYLAEHARLGIKVALKADKRTLSANREDLRREVDALKNLHHAYIPQVYDFIEEDGTVYTVMDYIDGESFDKPLKRGERFSQAQVIEWACQLLEAIVYLHSRPPHGMLHADIKPSNIMLTPQGDVCLIDFNIALALGEEGAVAVGRSSGYASPEHYGIYYMSPHTMQEITGDLPTDSIKSNSISKTESLPRSKMTESLPQSNPPPNPSSNSTGKKTIMLNVRSDIYSLGATLYHMLTGERPAQHAADVNPISTKDFSPAVVDIIAKAMNPVQFLRWQTAEEMLYAFEHLRENDPRTKRHKRMRIMTTTALTLLFLAGGFTIFAGQRLITQEQQHIAEEAQQQAEGAEEQASEAQKQASEAEEQAKLERIKASEAESQAENERIKASEAEEQAEIERQEALRQEAYALSEYSANSLRKGDTNAAINYALQALSNSFVPQAQKALTDALKVYDLSDGFKNHKTLELPSAPLYMRISPDGRTAAAIYTSAVAVFDTETAEIAFTFPADKSALAEVKFLDNRTIIYAGEGAIKAYDIKKSVELWKGKPATAITISEDKKTAAAIYKDEKFATIYDTASGQIVREIDFGGKSQRVPPNDIFANPNDNLLALNHDGTLLGVSFSDGSLCVYDLKNGEKDLEIFESSDYIYFEGGFFEQYFAFSATNASDSVFNIIDIAKMEQTKGFQSTSYFSTQTDKNGIYVQTENILVKIHPVDDEQIPLVYTGENISCFAHSENHTLITTKNEYMFFDKNSDLISRHTKDLGRDFVQIAENTALIGTYESPVIRIMKFENHPEADLFAYDASYGHSEARISADGKTIMLFSYEKFRLYEINGSKIADVEIPNAKELHDQQYRRDENGSWLELIYNDGTIRAYSAKNGDLLHETSGEKPNKDLSEVYFTDTLRIEAPLGGPIVAYDKNTGEKIRKLDEDAYLTYVTQAGEYIITQYLTQAGDFYGLLLNNNCETLAYLPYLCDIVGNELIFDYPTGNLRKSRIYDIGELIGFADKKRN
ncbi:MAG: protein kinase [Oscillospiraceae bacterium]|nr:protein kinase [Oscillospiraceae bacterium]